MFLHHSQKYLPLFLTMVEYKGMVKQRYLHGIVSEDLKEKMVFIGDPRQVGKTTFAQLLGKKQYDKYQRELSTLLTDNFQLLPAQNLQT